MINVEAKKYKVNVDACIYKIILNEHRTEYGSAMDPEGAAF